MRKSILVLSVFAFIGLTERAWAGPAEEVAQIAGPRGQAFEQGNAEAYSAAFADNAVLTSSLSAYRIEGKDAIQAYFVQLFQLYPGRRLFSRQPVIRAYGDNLVIQNAYNVLYVTDQARGKGHAADAALERGMDQGRRPLADRRPARLAHSHDALGRISRCTASVPAVLFR